MNAVAIAAPSPARIRWCGLLVGIATLPALLLPVASADAKKRRATCTPKHSTTVARSAAIRVYQTTVPRKDERVTRTYSCRLKTRRRVRLATLRSDAEYDTGTSADPITIHGRYVAYSLSNIDGARDKFDHRNRPGDKIVRLDTRKRRPKTLASTPNTTMISSLTLTTAGAVAWISSIDSPPPGPVRTTYTVGLSDRAGTRALASGLDILPGSLASSPSFVYWTRAGRPFSQAIR